MALSHLPRVKVVLSVDLTDIFDLTTVCFPSGPRDDVFHWVAVRSSGLLPDLVKALRASEVTEIACYFGKYQLHTGENIKWPGAAKCFWVTRSHLCKMCLCAQISCFSSRKTSQVVTIQNQGGKDLGGLLWGTKGNIVPVICGTLKGGNLGWVPSVLFPRDDKRTDLLMECPPRKFSLFFCFLFWTGGKNH